MKVLHNTIFNEVRVGLKKEGHKETSMHLDEAEKGDWWGKQISPTNQQFPMTVPREPYWPRIDQFHCREKSALGQWLIKAGGTPG